MYNLIKYVVPTYLPKTYDFTPLPTIILQTKEHLYNYYSRYTLIKYFK